MGRCNTMGWAWATLCLAICKHIIFFLSPTRWRFFSPSFSSLSKEKKSRVGFALHLGFLVKRTASVPGEFSHILSSWDLCGGCVGFYYFSCQCLVYGAHNVWLIHTCTVSWIHPGYSRFIRHAITQHMCMYFCPGNPRQKYIRLQISCS